MGKQVKAMNRALVVRKKNGKQLVKKSSDSHVNSNGGSGSKRVPSHAAQTQKLLAQNSRRKKLLLDIPSLVGVGRQHNKTLTAQQVVDALITCRGLVSYAAKYLGVSFQKLKAYINANAKMKEILNDVQEITTDYVESKLFNLIEREQEKSVHFYLRGKAKSRGYGDQHDDDIDKFPNITFVYQEVTREQIEKEREQERLMKDANPK